MLLKSIAEDMIVHSVSSQSSNIALCINKKLFLIMLQWTPHWYSLYNLVGSVWFVAYTVDKSKNSTNLHFSGVTKSNSKNGDIKTSSWIQLTNFSTLIIFTRCLASYLITLLLLVLYKKQPVHSEVVVIKKCIQWSKLCLSKQLGTALWLASC